MRIIIARTDRHDYKFDSSASHPHLAVCWPFIAMTIVLVFNFTPGRSVNTSKMTKFELRSTARTCPSVIRDFFLQIWCSFGVTFFLVLPMISGGTNRNQTLMRIRRLPEILPPSEESHEDTTLTLTLNPCFRGLLSEERSSCT